MIHLTKWLIALMCFIIILQSPLTIDKIPSYLIISTITLYLAHKLEINNITNLPKFNWKIISYYIWLIKEIIVSALIITKFILQPRIMISPLVTKITTKQKNDLTKTILANSITLTPGTITIEAGDIFLVHSITAKHAEELYNSAMEKKISKSYR